MMNKRILIILLVGTTWIANLAVAQVTVSVATDQSDYSEGEVIEVLVSLLNTSSDFVEFTTGSCPASFSFDGLEWPGQFGVACTGDEISFELAPATARVWTWRLDPDSLGLPMTSGEHEVIGFFASLPADTVVITAPRSLEGRFWIYLSEGVTENDLALLRDSLNAVVLQSSGRSQTWHVSGVQVDSVVAAYENDTRFRAIEVERSVVPTHSTVATSSEAPTGSLDRGVTVYPNPCSSQCTLEIGTGDTHSIRIALYNVLGQEVREISKRETSESVAFKRVFDVDDLPNGLYFIRAENEGDALSASVLVIR